MQELQKPNIQLIKNQADALKPLFLVIFITIFLIFFLSDYSFAGTGGTELSATSDKLKGLITGVGGKAIAFGGLIASGIAAVATQKWVPFLGLGGALLGMILAPGVIESSFTALI